MAMRMTFEAASVGCYYSCSCVSGMVVHTSMHVHECCTLRLVCDKGLHGQMRPWSEMAHPSFCTSVFRSAAAGADVLSSSTS